MGATSALLGERVARHGLGDRPAATPLAAAARTTAVQAQDNLASRLGLRARSATITDADVVHAIDVERTIVRTWLHRGTIHLVASADVRWLIRLVGPMIARKSGARWRGLGLTDDVIDRASTALADSLRAGPLTRLEIRGALAERGVTLGPDPQALTHAVVHASTTGLVCRGPDRGRDATFVLLADWLPGAPAGPSGDDALAELARRYFAAYSPATAADFATWSGLPATRAIELLGDELQPADVDGVAGYRLGTVEPIRATRLLPAFDNYLLGHRNRAPVLDGPHYGRVFDGGIIRPTVIDDGRVIGVWALHRPSGRVRVTPFERVDGPTADRIDAEVADVGRFLGSATALEFDDPPDDPLDDPLEVR